MQQRLLIKQKIETGQHLTIAQSHRLNQKVDLRLKLLQKLHDEEYKIEGQCPQCNYKSTPAEIILGFSESVHDFTTRCPKCETRFDPSLQMIGAHGVKTTLPFYCGDQALYMLKGLEVMPPDKYLENNKTVAMYRSLMVHYGSLKNAFREIYIEYSFEEVPVWKSKVRTFLGIMPDKEIAELCNVTVDEVIEYRESKGILLKKKIYAC